MQASGTEPGFRKNVFHILKQPGIAQLAGRHIHADRERWLTGVAFMPNSHLPASLPQYPPPQVNNQIAFLRNRDELCRRENAARRMIPTDQRLVTDCPVIAERHFCLVIEH